MPSPSASVSSDLKALYKSVITRHSLVRAKGEVLVLLFFFKFLFVRSTISRQSEGRFTPKFACGSTLVLPDVSPPLLWVSGPGGRKKGGNEIFVTMEVNGGIFAFRRFLSDISATRARNHTKYLYRENVCRRAPSPCAAHRPLGGRGEVELKTQKIGGWSHSCIGQLPFLFFSAMPNVVQYVGHRPAHILV